MQRYATTDKNQTFTLYPNLFIFKLAVLQTAPAITNELLSLMEYLPSIIQTGAENLKIAFKILDCYLLLGNVTSVFD